MDKKIILKSRAEFSHLIGCLQLHGIGIEIGVQTGEFSEVLIKSPLKKLYLLDSWEHLENYNDVANVNQKIQDYNFDLVKKRFANNSKVVIKKARAEEAVHQFRNETFDFIYHDANHSYEFLKKQLVLWWSKLKKGGIYAGHDYLDGSFENLGNFGVKSAVDEFAAKVNRDVRVINEPGKGWWFIK